ncbi:Hsp33 family molecular chaperone HslO [Yunchengibacter salinarum]|uniref:Hsp33 family molecular chaperone HslO n=1 Tax=Yunchengibacter salinarum TaxID=3133399 RepID=UPI0035B61010
MSETPIVVKDPADSRDNEVRPFQIEGMEVRGRAVRLGTTVDRILSAHDYPDPVRRVLGEVLVLTAMLGSMMKFEGIVTVQMKAEGPVPMMVADFERKADGDGHLRGYAGMDEDQLARMAPDADFKELISGRKGYFAITIDQGRDMERYQGIVDLDGDSVEEVARTYFRNSEQLPTAMQIHARRDGVIGHWRAGGIMVQHLARGEEGHERLLDRETEEQWNRAHILMETVTDTELLGPDLDLDKLLLRLFHEDGVRVFARSPVVMGCRCSRDRLLGVLSQFSRDDIDHMVVDGVIAVNCQFCNSTFDFDPETVMAAAGHATGPESDGKN